MVNALPQFDRNSPTWKWKTSVVTLERRMDHILYSLELDCIAAKVIPAGASDHFPVKAIFTREETLLTSEKSESCQSMKFGLGNKFGFSPA